MSYKITLTENAENGRKINLCVNKRTFNRILKDQFTGGFLRFHIDLIWDICADRANARPLKKFYNQISLTNLIK